MYGGPSLWGPHTELRAMLGLWALQREDGGCNGARGVHSASPTPRLSSQLKDKPTPPPRQFPQCKGPTYLSEPTGAKQPEGCCAEAYGKCSPSWERLVQGSGMRKRARGCEEWRSLDVILDQLEGLGGSAALCPQIPAPNLAHWAGGCVVALPGLRTPSSHYHMLNM